MRNVIGLTFSFPRAIGGSEMSAQGFDVPTTSHIEVCGVEFGAVGKHNVGMNERPGKRSLGRSMGQYERSERRVGDGTIPMPNEENMDERDDKNCEEVYWGTTKEVTTVNEHSRAEPQTVHSQVPDPIVEESVLCVERDRGSNNRVSSEMSHGAESNKTAGVGNMNILQIDSMKVDNDETVPLKSRCCPERLQAVISKLSDAQKEAVAELGFGSLLNLGCGRIVKHLCWWLLQRFDPRTMCLQLSGVKHKIDRSDFSFVMGVHDGGQPMVFRGSSELVHKLKNKFCLDKRGIPRSVVENVIHENSDGGNLFRQAFTLFVVGALLGPASSAYIPPNWLYTVFETESISSKNWASWSLEFLSDSVKKWIETGQQYCCGCLLFLQLFYFHHLPIGKELVDPVHSPIMAWKQRDIRALLAELNGDYECENKKTKRSGKNRTRTAITNDKHSHASDDITRVMEEVSKLRYELDELRSHFGATSSAVIIHTLEKKVESICADMATKNERRLQTMKEEIIAAITKRGYATGHSIDAVHEKDMHYKMNEDPQLACSGQSTMPKSHVCYGSPAQEIGKFSRKEAIIDAAKTLNEGFCYDSNVLHPKPLAFQVPEDLDNRPVVKIHEEVRTPYEEPRNTNPKFGQFGAELNSRSPVKIWNTSKRKLNQCISSSFQELKKGKITAVTQTVGPFTVAQDVHDEDRWIVSYIYDNTLSLDETMVCYQNHQLTRGNLQTLKPNEWVDCDVICMWVDFLVHRQKSKLSSEKVNWFLPTRYSQAVICGNVETLNFVNEHQIVPKYMYELWRCEKIFLPMHDKSPGHWYLLVVDLPTFTCEVWDTLPDAVAKSRREMACKLVLQSLDGILADEVTRYMGNGFKFGLLNVRYKPRVPRQANSDDCGVFVMKFMHNPNTVANPMSKHNCQEDRFQFTIDLVKSQLNEIRVSVLSAATSSNSLTIQDPRTSP